MELCGDEEMQQLLGAMAANDVDELALIERMIDGYPHDPRLHFLRGSMLAGSNRPIEAHAALSRAVEMAPEFAIARFQLGFFELTSGEAARALKTWEPLEALPEAHYLRHFVTGLQHLMHDRFAETLVALRAGIAVNDENPPLNRDMQLIIDRSVGLIESGEADGGAETSATSFLLDQFGGRGTTH
jgi:Flp pilus assembly protein TadD